MKTLSFGSSPNVGANLPRLLGLADSQYGTYEVTEYGVLSAKLSAKIFQHR